MTRGPGGQPHLTAIDAKQSDGVIVYVLGATITITSALHSDQVSVVITPDEQQCYQTRWKWFQGMFGRASQLVCLIWR